MPLTPILGRRQPPFSGRKPHRVANYQTVDIRPVYHKWCNLQMTHVRLSLASGIHKKPPRSRVTPRL